MVNKSDSRPGSSNTWDGLWTTEAPLNLKDNALLQADDVLFRYPTLIEQRPGLRQYQANATGYQPVAMNIKKVKNGTSTEDRILTTLVDTTRNAYFFADEGDNGILDATRNYWGNTNVIKTGQTGTDTLGMNMGEPKITNGIYMTHMGPGRLLDTPQYMSPNPSANYIGTPVYSKPLGIQSCVDTAIAFTVYNSGNVGSAGGGAAFIQPGQIHTVGGQAVIRVGDNYGVPSNTAYATAPAVPTLTGTVTLVSSGLYKITSTGPYTNISVGGAIQVTGSDKGSWIGTWTINAIDTANNTITIQSNGATLDVGTVQFNTYGFAMGIHMSTTLAKEYVWGDSFTFSTPPGGANFIRFGGGDISTFFQEGQVEFYRTPVAQSTPEVGAIDPGLEFDKVGSVPYNILNGRTYTIDSGLSDTGLGDPLYSNETLGGIGVQNYTPPQAKIHESFKSYEFYANTVERSIFTFTMPGVINMDIVMRITPNCNAQGSTESMIFYIKNSDIPDHSTLENYCRGICKIINANTDVPLNALYISTFSSTPGQIEIAALNYAASNIEVMFYNPGGGYGTVQTSVPLTPLSYDLTQYVNNITPASYKASLGGTYPTLSGMGYVTIPAIKTNRIYWSKIQQPGSVPLANSMDLPDNVVILGMWTDTNGLFVITDSGLWQVTGPSGDTDPWSLREYDLSAKCWSQGSINYLADKVYFATDQGIQVYGNGDIISNQITNQIQPIRKSVKRINTFWDFNAKGEPWISSTVDPFNQEYMLIAPSLTNTAKNRGLRYNSNNQAWSTFNRNVSCGLFSTKDDANSMMFADADLKLLLIERDDADALKYSDENFNLYQAGLEPAVELGDGTYRYYGFINQVASVCAVPKVNDFIIAITLKPGTSEEQNIQAIRILSYGPVVRGGINTYEMIVDAEIPTANENLLVQYVRAFQSNVGLNTFKGGNPTVLKRWSTVHINLQGSVREIDLDIHTDDRRLVVSHKLETINPEDGWGNHLWGNFAWGDELLDAQPELASYVPVGFNVANLLQVDVVNRGFNQNFRLQRVTVGYADASNRSKQ